MTTKKNSKKTTAQADNKIDFSDSIKAITETAKNVNLQMREVAEEVAADLRDNGEQLREMAVAPVKEAYEKAYEAVSEVADIDKLSNATKSANDYTLKTAEELVNGLAANGEKWQKVATKAVEGSLKLAAKQQDIVFGTLETVKGQMAQSVARFRKLFSNN